MEWKNWAGNVTAHPTSIVVAGSERDLVDVVAEAAATGQRIRAVGTAHSFSPICASNDILVSLDDSDICRISDEGVSTFWAGTKIASAAAALWEDGFSFENQGDIDVQSLAGAVSTGTHGTGVHFGSFSAKTRSITLVTSDGGVRTIDHLEPDLVRAAALSVGTLGLISEVGIEVSSRFHLREEAHIMEVEQCFETFENISAAHRHAEYYRLPGFDKCVIKTIDTSDETAVKPDPGELPPPGTIERYVRPMRANKAYLVYRNIRTVPFLEMEYSVPVEAGVACMKEIRRLMLDRFPNINWVTEYRTQAADTMMLSPANGRPVAAISVHDRPDGGPQTEAFFRACEQIFVSHDGRPHWGKLCFLSPSQRASLFPEFEEFSRIRQHLDPDGIFLNDYLEPLFR